MLTPLRMGFSFVYPNETSESCSSGGEIFSVSTNLYIISVDAQREGGGNVLELDDVVLLWWLELGKLLQNLDLGLSLSSSVGIVCSITSVHSLSRGEVETYTSIGR